MSTQEDKRTFYTLSDISKSIQRALAEKTEVEFWAQAEIVKLGYYPHSGHCYPQLVEKSSNKILAEMRGLIWKNDFIRINTRFKQVMGEGLKDGITIHFKTRLRYDAVYGLSLQILDIDPSYSLGRMEQQRLETIQRLTKENLFTLNKQLPEPYLTKSLAVISVATSKGYHDFTSVVNAYKRERDYNMEYQLFPALLQGDSSPKSIMNQLELIRNNPNFDAVAIIRGGGGDIGLSSYNNYELAKHIAEFPIPVYTGVGHATNETVSELVSYRYFITPTDLANYLMEKYEIADSIIWQARRVVEQTALQSIVYEEDRIQSIRKNIGNWSMQKLKDTEKDLKDTRKSISSNTKHILSNQKERLVEINSALAAPSSRILESSRQTLGQNKNKLFLFAERSINLQNEKLLNLNNTLELLSPQKILDRGFSISYQGNKVLKSIKEIDKKQMIRTQLKDGSFESKAE